MCMLTKVSFQQQLHFFFFFTENEIFHIVSAVSEIPLQLWLVYFP